MTETSINWQPANLANTLVRLEPLTARDFEKLFEIASDPLIWEQHPSKDRYKREVFQSYFDGALKSGTAFLIVDRLTDDIIGSTRFYDYKPGKSIAIGFTFLCRPYWGGRHNWSSKKLLLDYAFKFVDEVYFHIGSANLRSQLAIRKIGAVKVNEVNIDDNGLSRLHYEYLISKETWKSNNNEH